MLFSLFFFILIIVVYYYQKYTLLLCISLSLLLYTIFLYNCFYDNQIISSWLAKQNIESIERLTFQSPEFEYNTIINKGIVIISSLLLGGFFIFKIFFCS